MAAHAPRAGLPLLTRRVFEQTLIHGPRHAAVVGPAEDTWIAPEPQFGVLAGLDVPRRVQLELAVLGQSELFGPLPGLPQVVGTMDARAVEEAVGRRVERAVTGIDDGVVHAPAGKQRALDLPACAPITAEQEEALARADG